jgi:hypothetical protein
MEVTDSGNGTGHGYWINWRCRNGLGQFGGFGYRATLDEWRRQGAGDRRRRAIGEAGHAGVAGHVGASGCDLVAHTVALGGGVCRA